MIRLYTFSGFHFYRDANEYTLTVNNFPPFLQRETHSLSSFRTTFEKGFTAEIQWLENGWLVYHGFFVLVFEYLTKTPIALDIIVLGIILGDFLNRKDSKT